MIAMEFKDFSFEVALSHTDGLATLVDRFGVDKYSKKKYKGVPHLRVKHSSGWIDVWPDYVCARLLTLRLPEDMDENQALSLVNGPILERLKELACREQPKLEFDGRLIEGTECGGNIRVWKVCSTPASWVGQLREEMRSLVLKLGFQVDGLVDLEDELHVTIRGRKAKAGTQPSKPADTSPMNLTFEKVGFRRRFFHGCECFGSVCSINFGTADVVRASGPAQLEFRLYANTELEEEEWPPLKNQTFVAAKRQRSVNTNADDYTRASVLELHRDTPLPLTLKDDIEIACAASLQTADEATAQQNASVCQQVVQSARFQWTQLFTESLVVLKISRNPSQLHTEIQTCKELKQCRDQLKEAGSEFMLPCRAYAFVRPDQYSAMLKAIQIQGKSFASRHIIVSQEHEAAIRTVIERMPCNHKVHTQAKYHLPTGLASEALKHGLKIEIKKTFLDIKSSSSTTGKHPTASTTEVHGGKNPRHC